MQTKRIITQRSTSVTLPAMLCVCAVLLGRVAGGADPAATGAARDVVVRQMTNLSKWHTDNMAAQRVFDDASPGNQATTGPLPRFRGLVESTHYVVLIDNRGWQVGRAVVRDDYAIVLVTLIDGDNQLRLFRFYLSRVDTTTGRQWMTDTVLEVTQRVAQAPIGESS
jgi:hypothetical protein